MGIGLLNLYNCFCPYAPPCQRKPYYDDPRDLTPEERVNQGFKNVNTWPFGTTFSDLANNISNVASVKEAEPGTLELIECDECHTFFQSDYISARLKNSRNLCPECQKKGGV